MRFNQGLQNMEVNKWKFWNLLSFKIQGFNKKLVSKIISYMYSY